ncbi:fructose-6-phosphate aldolase [Enterococcus sp. BWM-S5]|uniref:Fructose-6-phosphate aldolase n=1 Tax=Enterococcus larvae TaxID=2794352 RepID=A0ABS4CMP1_9ENTE|nr:fructose-6-phosphate aldolase [Enterococcus larvae]MBP1047758.1 fructose-6-phosphate aldolase [Enterococcus larvae]
MEFMLDTANLADIKKYAEIIPLAGVTSNPSIVKNEGKIVFFEHMKKIREIIGKDCSLHVQVVAQDFDGMMADARAILANIDQKVYIKVPVNEEGLKVIKALKQEKIHVTATAIYTKFQAYLAIAAGADYIAPYFNRMENLNIDPREAIKEMALEIARTNSSTKILAASFKNVAQVNGALENGAQAATMGTDIISQAFSMPSIQKAVEDFTADWEQIFEPGTKISDL